jgi:hypothetical protein
MDKTKTTIKFEFINELENLKQIEFEFYDLPNIKEIEYYNELVDFPTQIYLSSRLIFKNAHWKNLG